MYPALLLASALAIACPAYAWEEREELTPFLEDATFVLYDHSADRLIGFDRDRAERRYVPASTFKIPNSLIALHTGAVTTVDELVPYHSENPPFMKEWAHDMNLRDAMKLSNVPIYQELARRIGLTRMEQAVSSLAYGNQTIGTTVDRFWLDGPLQISAIEQAQFLAKLATSALPLPASVQRSVREILLLETNPKWKLYGKTGWQNAPGVGIGWWVGWVEKGDRVYSFALNMDLQNKADADRRVAVGRMCLKALGVTP